MAEVPISPTSLFLHPFCCLLCTPRVVLLSQLLRCLNSRGADEVPVLFFLLQSFLFVTQMEETLS